MDEYIMLPLTVRGRTTHVHGTTAEAEFSENDPHNSVKHYGWGIEVAALGHRVWLHVPIPVDVDWTERVLSGEEIDSLFVVSEVGLQISGFEHGNVEFGALHFVGWRHSVLPLG